MNTNTGLSFLWHYSLYAPALTDHYVQNLPLVINVSNSLPNPILALKKKKSLSGVLVG